MTTPAHSSPLLRPKPAGFTLAELLVAVVVAVLLVIIFGSSFVLNQRVTRVSQAKAELLQNGRQAGDVLARELRQANTVVTVLPADASDLELLAHELEFEDGHDDTQIQYIRYYLDGTDMRRQIKVYWFASDPSTYVHWNDTDAFGGPSVTVQEDKLMGEFFSSLNFYGVSTITIELGLTKNGYNVDLTSAVSPRNT